MTDKDILEEAKEYWAYDSESKKSRVTMTQEKYYAFKLIEEVEKLRERPAVPYLNATCSELNSQIESLTKELENFEQDRDRWIQRYEGAKEELEEAKGDRDRQKAKYHRLLGEMFRNEPMRDLAKKEQDLEAANKERDSLETMIKLWEKRNRENAEAIEKLEAQLEVAEKERDLFKDLHYLCASDEIIKAYNRLEIFKSELEAENKELSAENHLCQQSIKELKAKVEVYNNFVDKCFLVECPENRKLHNEVMEIR